MITREYIKNLLLNGYDISDIDYSHITDMSYMFVNDDIISYIPDFDVSHVVNMEGMFYGCRNLKKSPLINTSSATNMKEMFRGCFELITVCDLDTSKVVDLEHMFSECSSLKFLSPLDLSNADNVNNMFNFCYDIHFNLNDWKLPENLNLLEMLNNSFLSGEDFLDCVGLDNSIKIVLDNDLCDPFFARALISKNYNTDVTDKIIKIINDRVINK